MTTTDDMTQRIHDRFRRAGEENMLPDTLVLHRDDLEDLTKHLYPLLSGQGVITTFMDLDVVVGESAWHMFGLVPPERGHAIFLRRPNPRKEVTA